MTYATGLIDHRLPVHPDVGQKLRWDNAQQLRCSMGVGVCGDDALGRCLDALSEYGVTKLFSELAFEIGMEQRLLGSTVHINTTSLTVFGSYEEQDALAKKMILR